MKLSKKLFILTGIIMVMLIVLAFSTIDYHVSKAIINKHSIFAEFFNRFGELPTALALLISTAIFFGSRKKEQLISNLFAYLVGLPFMALFSLFTVFMPVRYAYEHVESGIPTGILIFTYVLALFVFIISLLIVRKMDSDKLRRYRKAAFVLLFLAIGAIFFINIVKILWARPRMRSITSIEDFKYWYQIAGPTMDNELKSFPSGHTANSFIMIAYTMFIENREHKKKFMIFGLFWGSMVALSRVIIGAHFLSDVIVGGYITILLFFVLEYMFIGKGEKNGTRNI